jgi:hypothetical protein
MEWRENSFAVDLPTSGLEEEPPVHGAEEFVAWGLRK